MRRIYKQWRVAVSPGTVREDKAVRTGRCPVQMPSNRRVSTRIVEEILSGIHTDSQLENAPFISILRHRVK
jgi:hypothetical protein